MILKVSTTVRPIQKLPNIFFCLFDSYTQEQIHKKNWTKSSGQKLAYKKSFVKLLLYDGGGVRTCIIFFLYIYIFFMRNLEIKELSLAVFDYVSSVKQRRLNVSRQVTSFTLSVKLYVLKIPYFLFIVIILKVIKV